MENRGRSVFIFCVLLAATLVSSCHVYSSDQLSLSISSALNSIPSDGLLHPAFFVTVVDSTGKPFILSSPVNVTVSSSDEMILSVQRKATIAAGEYFVIINASSTVPEKKTVEVSVSASGFQSSKIKATVEPPAGTPKSLDVTLLPDILVPRAGAYASVVVTIVDAYNKPAKARTDTDVTLSSSNIRIADLSSKVVRIPKGSFSGKTSVVSTGFIGNAIVTASTSNLKPDSATIMVSGPRPEKLSVWLPPAFVQNETAFAFVGIVDKDLKPAKVSSQVRIQLFSSNTTIFTVQGLVTVETDGWSGLAEIRCLRVGSATLYAMAEDVSSTSATVNVLNQGLETSALKVYSMANFFPADEKAISSIAIQSVDEEGNPTMVQDSLQVNVFSSYSGIFDTVPSATIQAGSSLAYVQAVPREPGNVKVTAGALNFSSTEAQVVVYSPTPSTVSIITPPIPSDGEVDACLVLSSSGLPAPISQDTQVLFSSSDTRVAEVDSTAILGSRKYYVSFKVRGRSPGQFSLTAIGGGFPSISSNILVHEVKPSIFYLSNVKPLAETEFPFVVQVVSSTGSPAVGDEAITLDLASSNTSVIEIPETARIESERAEVLLTARGAAQGRSLITVSSGGFTSLIVEMDSQSFSASIRIVAADTYRSGEMVKILAEVSLEGEALDGVTVRWIGEGLAQENTVTNSQGFAENTLAVRDKENLIEAEANIPGSGYITCSKMIYGARMYHLDVSSNRGFLLNGSGDYLEGSMVTLSAPPIVSMSSILGMLGGKHVFREWTGAPSATNSTATITIGGDELSLIAQAVYSDDYFGMMISLGIVAGVASAGTVAFIFVRRRRSEEE